MCVAALPAVLGLAGSAISAIGTMQQGAHARRIAERNAEIMREQGRYKARQIRKKVDYTQSQVLAQAGNRGLTATGSVFDVMIDNATQGEIDAANATRFANDQAEVQVLEGKAAQASANNTAFGMIIGGAGQYLRMTN